MSDFQEYEGSMTTIAFLVVVGFVLIILGFTIVGPALYQFGILSFEGSATHIARTINFTFQNGYGFLSPIHLSDKSIIFQIYCDSDCASQLRNLYRQGIALKDSLKCQDSFCICLGTLDRETKEEFISGRDHVNEKEYNKVINYVEGIDAQFILGKNENGAYRYFIYEGGDYFESLNCAPSVTFLVVDNEECSSSNTCYLNVLTYVYANGTYSFSSNLEKSSNNIGVVVRE